eukprot:scaffold14398_cov83-Phaeocystis_antarctica.AAC.1
MTVQTSTLSRSVPCSPRPAFPFSASVHTCTTPSSPPATTTVPPCVATERTPHSCAIDGACSVRSATALPRPAARSATPNSLTQMWPPTPPAPDASAPPTTSSWECSASAHTLPGSCRVCSDSVGVAASAASDRKLGSDSRAVVSIDHSRTVQSSPPVASNPPPSALA